MPHRLIALRVLTGLAVALSTAGCSRIASRTAAPTTTVLSPTTTSGTGPAHGSYDPNAGTGPARGTYDPYAGTAPATGRTGRTVEGDVRTPDGRSRHYRLYVPPSLPTGQRVPLLVALHGGLGTSEQFQTNSGFDALAEANGFIVVYLDGIGALPGGRGPQTWNGGYCCGAAADKNIDDVGFVRQLVDTIVAAQPVDPARVVAAGHSNGAILAYRLACELSDRIAAIGVQAGSLGIDACTPSRPVAVFHLHGTADTNHPIDGGAGTGLAGVAFRSARAAVDTVAAADGCATTPTPATTPGNPDLATLTWEACRAGTTVRLVVVTGATHAWMGHPGASERARSFVGTPYPDLDASRAIWSFLAAQRRR